MSLRFCYARCHYEERSYDYLCSYPLDPINRPYQLVLKGVYLDIRGVVYYRYDYRSKEPSRRRGR